MHIEARLFEFLTAFFALCAVGYGALTALYGRGGIEWAGTTALVLTTGLSLITGTFFRFVARRLDTRPEDYEDAEISDGAGELGFYSPHRGRDRAVVAMVDRRGCLLRAGDRGRPGVRVLHRSREALTTQGARSR
jgi:hypothetical protein